MRPVTQRTSGISLKQLLPQARIFGDDDIRFSSCCGDSRLCRPGDLFVALVGPEYDGHDFALEAVERGASAVLAEQPLPARVPVGVVSDTRVAFGRVCQSLAGNPVEQLRVTGVTGTNGKTVSSLLVAAVLEAAGRPSGLLSSLAYSDSLRTEAPRSTTPAPPEMADWLARTLANGCADAVIEVSGRALADRRVSGLELDGAIVTNLRHNPSEHSGSLLDYRRTKQRIFDLLRPHGVAVMNADDAGSQALLQRLACPVITFGLHQDAEVTATVLERHSSEQTFLLSAGAETHVVRTQLIGDHHVSNCLAAAALGLVYGIDLATIVKGLESVTHVPGRLQRIECGQPFGVFVDSSDTPDRLAVNLKTLRRVTKGRLICVYGTRIESAAAERAMLGRVAERSSDLSIITSGGLGDAEPLATAHELLDGYDVPARAHVIPTRRQAIEWALGEAQPGDAVLLAGAAPLHLAGQEIPDELLDQQTARRWLGGHKDRGVKDRPALRLFAPDRELDGV